MGELLIDKKWIQQELFLLRLKLSKLENGMNRQLPSLLSC